MDRVRTVATFIAGVLVGGSAVYFSPPNRGTTSASPPGAATPLLPPLPEGQGGPPGGAPGQPGAAGQPGAMGQAGPAGTMGKPGEAGAGMPGEGAPGAGAPTAGAPGTQPVGAAATGVVPMPDPNLPSPDAAEGPPPDEIPAAPPGAVQQSGSRLEKHLRIATSVWQAQADVAKASSKEAIRALAGDIEIHAQNVPPIGDHMPPMQEVAGYLATSRVLLDRMSAAGMDVADLSLQVDMMMRPPKGKIPGGPKAGGAPAPK